MVLVTFTVQRKKVQNICSHYFSVAMVKYHDHGNLEKEGFIWDYGFRGMRPSCQGSMAARSPAGSREIHLEVKQGLQLSKPTASDVPSPSKTVPTPKALQREPPGN